MRMKAEKGARCGAANRKTPDLALRPDHGRNLMRAALGEEATALY
jgi:hypothetical protein